MEISEFRIKETINGFYVERLFSITDVKFNWFRLKLEVVELKKEWDVICIDGSKSFYIGRINEYLVDKLKPFKSIEKANEYICKLVENSKFVNKIHIPLPCN